MTTQHVENDMLRAYERGRVRFALCRALSVLCGVALVMAVSPKWPIVVGLGVALAALMGGSAFYGQVAYAGVRSGFVGGLFPLGLTFLTRNLGQCSMAGGVCFSWCLAACTLGGVAAASVILALSGKWRGSPPFWGMASLGLMLTGSMSCGCAGIMGFAALTAGFMVGMVPVRRFIVAT